MNKNQVFAKNFSNSQELAQTAAPFVLGVLHQANSGAKLPNTNRIYAVCVTHTHTHTHTHTQIR